MHLTENKILTETIYNGKIINLRKDTVTLPNGRAAHREVVEHPGGVCVLPLTKDDTVIMVKQFRHSQGGTFLEIPAGRLEINEDPLKCGERELFEETGLTAKRYDYLGKVFPIPSYCEEIIHMYLARGLCGDTTKNNPDEDEFVEVVRLPFNEVIDMIFRNEIPDAKTQIAMLKARVLLSG